MEDIVGDTSSLSTAMWQNRCTTLLFHQSRQWLRLVLDGVEADFISRFMLTLSSTTTNLTHHQLHATMALILARRSPHKTSSVRRR